MMATLEDKSADLSASRCVECGTESLVLDPDMPSSHPVHLASVKVSLRILILELQPVQPRGHVHRFLSESLQGMSGFPHALAALFPRAFLVGEPCQAAGGLLNLGLVFFEVGRVRGVVSLVLFQVYFRFFQRLQKSIVNNEPQFSS